MSWRHLMNLVGLGVDEEGEVWMWTDDPSSVDWVVTVRQRWSAVETVEKPRRHHAVELDVYETLGYDEPGLVRPAFSVVPLSAWRVDRDRLVGLDIDFGGGRRSASHEVTRAIQLRMQQPRTSRLIRQLVALSRGLNRGPPVYREFSPSSSRRRPDRDQSDWRLGCLLLVAVIGCVVRSPRRTTSRS